MPLVHGRRQHLSAPGLFFTGFRAELSGQLRLMRFDARAIARAVASRDSTAATLAIPEEPDAVGGSQLSA
jgi:hypothetical protein